MQADAERTLNNLHILGALSQNDKLLTNEDSFDIHSPTTLRAVWRFWLGERRGVNVQRVKICIRNAMSFASSSLDEATDLLASPASPTDSQDGREDSIPDSMRLRVDTTVMQHVRMMNALGLASKGLTNLLQTYRDDPALASQIQLVVHEIDDFTTVIEPHSASLRRRCASISAREERERRTQPQ
jgi:hypothetical protein